MESNITTLSIRPYLFIKWNMMYHMSHTNYTIVLISVQIIMRSSLSPLLLTMTSSRSLLLFTMRSSLSPHLLTMLNTLLNPFTMLNT